MTPSSTCLLFILLVVVCVVWEAAMPVAALDPQPNNNNINNNNINNINININLFEAAFQGTCGRGSPCEQLCYDLHDGMFECDCRDGFILHQNGYSCLEMNTTMETPSANDVVGEEGEVADDDEGDILYQKDASFSIELDMTESNGNQIDTEEQSEQQQFPPGTSPPKNLTLPIVTLSSYSSTLSTSLPSRGGTADDSTQTQPTAPAIACVLDCGTGGACTVEGARQRCQCPLGRGGHNCHQDVSTRSPRFSGQSWLAFPALRAAYKRVQMRIEFRPETLQGILFLTGERDDMAGDFMALILHHGYLEFRFDCGSGVGVVRSDKQVLLNQWNHVTLYRHRWDAWLQLNDGAHIEGRSKGLFSRITFREPVFIGGPGNTTGLADKLPVDEGLRGCVRHLEVNDYIYSFNLAPIGDAVKGFDIDECTADRCSQVPCRHGGKCLTSNDSTICLCPLGFAGDLCETRVDLQVPAFNGSSYLRFAGLGSGALSWLDVQIVFRAAAEDGVIIYNGHRNDGVGDFMALYLAEGHVEFTFDLGTGSATIRSSEPVAMNLWHEVRVSRTGRQAVLQIDDRPSSQATAPGAFTQLSLPQNLYIGGVPNFEMVSPKVRVRTSFVGCIQKVLINGKSLEMLSSALGGINIVNCNHPCASRPCGSGARCVPILDSYQCECLGDEPGVPAPEEGCPDGENDEDFDVDVEASILADNNEAILDVSEDVAEGLLQDIPVPRFNGESFLHYTDAETIRRILSFQLNINIRFRTTSPDGLLLWSGRQKDEETENEEKGRSKKDEQHPTVNLNGNNRGDFLALGLSDGYLHFRFNLGGGELFLRYNSTRVDDGLWHRVQAFRNEQQGSLVVDNGVKLSRRAPGTLKQLNTNTGLYIGGMENLENGSNGKYHSGLIGCISDLILDTDYHLKLVQMASAGRNVQHCD